MPRSLRCFPHLAAVPLLLLATAATAPVATSPEAMVFSRYAPTVVTVKVVLKTELQVGGQGQDQETTLETVGAVVDPGGLVMLWNSQISSTRVMDVLRQTGVLPDDFEVKMTPTDFKVLLSGDTRERRAFLAASDSDLDLAFLQLEKPVEKPLAAVDFSASASPSVGQEVVAVSRLNPSFDAAAFFERGCVAGELKKPRPAWILDGELSGIGLPVFDLQGRPVGVLSTVLSSVASSGRPGGGVPGVMGMIAPKKTLGPLGLFLLPGEEVGRVVAQAKERAAKLLRERGLSDEPHPVGEPPTSHPEG